MLIRLLRTYLRPYKRQIYVLLGLQGIQAMANLYLPNLNASVIDKGILRGNTHYIWRTGGLMLGVTIVQAIFAVTAVYVRSRVAKSFGRDVRGGLFHRALQLSAPQGKHLRPSSL